MNNYLENKILHDIAKHMKKILANCKISFSHDAADQEIFLEYMNAFRKRICPKPRKVIFSKELQRKIDNKCILKNGQLLSSEDVQNIVSLIRHFKQLFEDGADLNNHLSTQIFTSKRQDILFNTWNIKHIHLNKVEAVSKNAMKNNRADYLLFCVVENDSVYFLDVRHHPNRDEFSSYSFLKIAFNNNWMQHLGFVEMGSEYVPHSIQPAITNDKDIYELYSNKLNLAFDFEGHGYISIETGITRSGDKIANVVFLNQVKKQLRNLPFSEDDYVDFTPDNDEGISGIIKFNCGDKVSTYRFNFD